MQRGVRCCKRMRRWEISASSWVSQTRPPSGARFGVGKVSRRVPGARNIAAVALRQSAVVGIQLVNKPLTACSGGVYSVLLERFTPIYVYHFEVRS